MKKSNVAPPALMASLALLFALAFVATGCSSRSALAEAPVEAPAAAAVEVAEVQTGAMSEILEYTGSLQPQRSVTIVPRAGGPVLSVPVKVGDEIKAGDTIIVIDSTPYKLQLQQAQVNLDLSRLRMAKMKQGTRPEQLAAARAAAAIAHAALKDAKNPNEDTRTVAAANLAQAEAGVRLAQYQYDKISWADQAGMTKEALQLQQATTAYEQAKAAYDMQMNPSDSKLAAIEGQVVQADLNLALAEHPVEQVDFDMAGLTIKQAETAVAQAQLQVDYATVTAPFDGVVAELYVHPGNMVGPTVPVALVISPEMEVALNVEERHIAEIAPGQNAALKTNAYPDRSFPALVTSVSPAADARTHTFIVKVTPADGDGLLRSGMYANTSILTQDHPQAVLVPRAAVTEVGGQSTVYVVTPLGPRPQGGGGVASGVKGGRAEPRTVTTGLSDAERIEITSGLAAGETVVVAGQANLGGGAPVTVVGE